MKTHGTARLIDGEWIIKADPHVLLKLKRVFGKVDHRAAGVVAISDTIETCRDLVWFCRRYPLRVDKPAYLTDRATEHKNQAQEVEAVLSGAIKPRRFALAVPARAYQQQAADIWLRVKGLLLADDVGTGKTASAICGLTDPKTRPAVVVTLAHLPHQWQRELARFAPDLHVHVVTKGTPYDMTLADRRRARQTGATPPTVPDVIVLNYHKLHGWADYLAKFCKSVIFDEVQELRHHDTARYHGARNLADAMTYKLGLSATPIYNLGSEFFAVLEILRPGTVGKRDEFLREWCRSEDAHGRAAIQNPRAFGSYLREQAIMVRRTRSDVGRELPRLTKIPHEVASDSQPFAEVSDRVKQLAKLILSGAEDPPAVRGAKWQASQELDSRLRQATGVAKAPYVADFVSMLVESGERVLLYGWHHTVYRIWRDKLRHVAPRGPAFYTGEESPAQKEAQKQAFISGDTPVLIMSLRAGAGLDGLQRCCRTVVFGELDWSPGVHEQAVGRVYRDGQPDPVCAYFLTTEFGSDPTIIDTLGIKAEQIEGVRTPTGELVTSLEVDPHHIKRLATAVLAGHGRPRGER